MAPINTDNLINIFLISGIFILLLTHCDKIQNDQRTQNVHIYDARQGVYKMVDKVYKSEDEWRRQLSPEQYNITRKKGTERPFTGKYYDHKEEGIYQCVCCGNDLFSSRTKFDSGTGWPSFWEPIAKENIKTKRDNTLFLNGTQVLCSKCDAHLGHLFDDGPPPTHKRYCINSIALNFIKHQFSQALEQP